MSLINYFLTFCLLLSTAALQAQSNYISGYIIKANKDTLHGQLDFRGDVKNATQIKFRSTEEDDPKVFYPEELYGYVSDDNSYRSKQIKVKDSKGILKPQTVFFQVLEQGRLNLYYYKAKDLSIHYYVEKDSLLEELTNEDIYSEQNGRKYSRKSLKYLYTLRSLFKGCSAISLTEENKFEEDELKKLVFTYNHCGSTDKSPESDTLSTKKHATQIHFTALFGLNTAFVRTTDPVFIKSYDKRQLGINAGIAMNFYFYRVHKNISLQLDLTYNQKGIHPTGNAPKMNLQYLDQGILIKYLYPKGKVRPFLAAGVVFGVLLNANEADYFGDRAFFSWYEPGYAVESGLLFPTRTRNAFSFTMRYEYTMITTGGYYNYYNEVLQFKLGYRFR